MIVATMRATNGVTVRIHDDRIAPPGSEDERRAIEAQCREAHDIITAYAEREARKENGVDKMLQRF